MQAKTGRSAVALALTLVVAACSPPLEGDRTDLMRLRSKDGPDEFAILPPKALEMPGALNDLPPPTPGGSNRTDQRPLDDAVIALGGKPGAGGGIPAADAAIAGHTGRFGTESGIRGQLAADDLTYRQKRPGRVFDRLFGNNSYYSAYEKQSLDQQSEIEYWRARGLLTPSAPPRGYDKEAEAKAARKKARKTAP
ncbi:DUF3035 domain-containing protein [Pseudogemmobacter faecipullorum]|uniref:DUF3035 domain-containing protein n=1 Tax=Pseudogemmobacter faecipullorum TaxID=2755041 RepID=A0ABS8CGT7_9RHOB|nr:DUF3035 domain-containing protein [Pseudogemmobacter faecipullorum]MCB5408596.1 DUF3035 domain-containing protein [Pseudogemmobacter faecipullorum]